MTNEVQESLKQALERLDNGNQWVKGHFVSENGYCALGAIGYRKGRGVSTLEACGSHLLADAIRDLGYWDDHGGYGDGIPDWNDEPERSWPQVKEAFELAIEKAETWAE